MESESLNISEEENILNSVSKQHCFFTLLGVKKHS